MTAAAARVAAASTSASAGVTTATGYFLRDRQSGNERERAAKNQSIDVFVHEDLVYSVLRQKACYGFLRMDS
jgi:hypothetical protein